MATKVEIKISLTREQFQLLVGDIQREREEYQKLWNQIGNKPNKEATDEDRTNYDFYAKEITKRKALEVILGYAFRIHFQ